MKSTRFFPVSLLLFSLLCSCSNSTGEESFIKKNYDFAGEQLALAIENTYESRVYHTYTEEYIEKEKQRKRWPLVSPRTLDEDGKLVLVSSRDWTSGFFPGELWYMYAYTGDPEWEAAAREFTGFIEREKENGGTHDMGFKIYCSVGNGYRFTKDEHYREVLLEAAKTLTSRFKPQAGIIRSWDHNAHKWQCPVIIDNMMNLELLFWAFRETNDSTYYQVAVSHAEKTIENHFRKDFSTYHVIDYDTLSGSVLKRNTHQGYSDESIWSRGQAWAIYGYTMCYRETQKPEFLEQAQRATALFFEHPNLPEDLIPYWDFDAPGIPNAPRDASAAAITASALLELTQYDRDNAQLHLQRAHTILHNLTENYRAKPGESHGFLLLHSTGSASSNHEVDTPLVYADYYFLEALLRKHQLATTGSIF